MGKITVKHDPASGRHVFSDGDYRLEVSDEEYRQLMKSLNGLTYRMSVEKARNRRIDSSIRVL